MLITEPQLIAWSKPVSKTEDQKCQNAIKQITTAIKNKYGSLVSIFLQGSYENNTNVKKDSDVDIVVRLDNIFYPSLIRLNEEQQRYYYSNIFVPSPNTFSQFKNDIEKVLQDTFEKIERKNKCLLVEGNATRVGADVIPCFVLKRFKADFLIEVEGIEMIADNGTAIISFPEQHAANGVTKTHNTGRMYKRIVRILKNIKIKLVEQGKINDDLVSSFLIESLVYNVPNSNFIVGNYVQTLKNIITIIYHDMNDLIKAKEYKDVSESQWLFVNTNYSPEKAKEFMLKCWQYAEFK